MAKSEIVKAEYKQKMFRYRKARFHESSLTLESALQQALDVFPQVGERWENITHEDANDGLRRFVNSNEHSRNLFFGDLVMHAPGEKNAVEIDPKAKELSVSAIAPSIGENGKRREFLESILYFAARKNHVAIIQSQSLRVRDIENHLNWLLRESGVISKDDQLALDNELPKFTRDKIQDSRADVKNLKVSADLVDEWSQSKEGDDSNVNSVKYSPKGGMLETIKGLLVEGYTLDLDSILDDPQLEVIVEVKHKRKKDPAAQRLINQITRGLRHVPESDIMIEIDNIGKVKGSELSIQSKESVKCYKELLDREDLIAKMSKWLDKQITSGLLE